MEEIDCARGNRCRNCVKGDDEWLVYADDCDDELYEKLSLRSHYQLKVSCLSSIFTRLKGFLKFYRILGELTIELQSEIFENVVSGVHL